MYPGKPVMKPGNHLIYPVTLMCDLINNIVTECPELWTNLSGFDTYILCRRTKFPRPIPGISK